jgi:hypothetical protein
MLEQGKPEKRMGKRDTQCCRDENYSEKPMGKNKIW